MFKMSYYVPTNKRFLFKKSMKTCFCPHKKSLTLEKLRGTSTIKIRERILYCTRFAVTLRYRSIRMIAKERTYIAIDLKSFYASVECVERGLDALTTRLVVADESRTDKTICLAVSPALKAYGLPGRPRLFEVRQRMAQLAHTHPELPQDYIVAPPRMALYMKYSTQIYRIYLRHVSSADIHVYSIDEVFIDVTNYLPLLGITAQEMAMRMIRQVLSETGITATAGIGTNLYLAKVAMDIVAKRIPADVHGVRIAQLNEQTYREQLWGHRPLTTFWRMGSGIAQRLARMNIYTMGQLARFSLTHEDLLYRMFGVNAELIIDHAWGWEPCSIADIKSYRPESSSICSGQVLNSAYDADKALTVLREMVYQLSLDLVERGVAANTLTLYVGYDRESLLRPEIAAAYKGAVVMDHYGRQVPKPAHGNYRFPVPTSSSRLLTQALLDIYNRIVNQQLLVRRLNLTAGQLVSQAEADKLQCAPRQLDLFVDNETIIRQEQAERKQMERERNVQKALLNIKHRFGKNAILMGTSFKEGATARERNQSIGGHHE